MINIFGDKDILRYQHYTHTTSKFGNCLAKITEVLFYNITCLRKKIAT